MSYPAWLTVSPTSGSGGRTVTFTATPNTGRNARSYPTTNYDSATKKGVKFTANGTNKYVKVKQAGKGAFVTLNGVAQLDASTKQVTVTGTSNSAYLTFSLVGNTTVSVGGTQCQMKFSNDKTTYGGDNASYAILGQYSTNDSSPLYYVKIGGVSVPQRSGKALLTADDQTAVEIDPGATEEYEFEISITLNEANTNVLEERIDLVVQAAEYTSANESATKATVTINRASGSQFEFSIQKSSTNTTAVTAVTIPQAGTAQTVYVKTNADWAASSVD